MSKVLEIGWNNVSKQAHRALQNYYEADHRLLLFPLSREGWILHVPSIAFADPESSLAAALKLAKVKGCAWLVIGSVAKEISELSIYESDEDLDDEDFMSGC